MIVAGTLLSFLLGFEHISVAQPVFNDQAPVHFLESVQQNLHELFKDKTVMILNELKSTVQKKSLQIVESNAHNKRSQDFYSLLKSAFQAQIYFRQALEEKNIQSMAVTKFKMLAIKTLAESRSNLVNPNNQSVNLDLIFNIDSIQERNSEDLEKRVKESEDYLYNYFEHKIIALFDGEQDNISFVNELKSSKTVYKNSIKNINHWMISTLEGIHQQEQAYLWKLMALNLVSFLDLLQREVSQLI